MRRYVVSLPPATLSMPLGPVREHRLAPRVRRRPVAARQHAQAAVRRARLAERRRPRPTPRRAPARTSSSVTRHRLRLAVVQRVRRAEQEHALPRDREADAHLVVRDRQRGVPVLAAVDDDVHALAQAHRRRAPSGSSSRRTRSTHGPGGVDDRLGAHRDHAPVDRDLGAAGAKRHDLRVVQDGRAAIGGGADVRERQPAVVRPRVRVERARAQRAAVELRHEPVRALELHEPVQLRARERRVERGSRSARTTAGTARPRRAGRGTAAGGRGAARRRSSAPAARGAPRGRGRRRRAAGSAARRGSASTTRSTSRRRSRRLSTSATASPCADAASAMPAPTIPPPITSRSNSRDASCSSAATRSSTAGSSTLVAPARSHTSMRPNGASGGFSSRTRVISPAGRARGSSTRSGSRAVPRSHARRAGGSRQSVTLCAGEQRTTTRVSSCSTWWISGPVEP